MNSKKLLALYGLKWDPFSPEIPHEALLVTPKIDHFAWRVEQLAQEGGFALITGESGTGKSVTLKCILGLLKPDAGMIQVDIQIPAKAPSGPEVPLVISLESSDKTFSASSQGGVTIAIE